MTGGGCTTPQGSHTLKLSSGRWLLFSERLDEMLDLEPSERAPRIAAVALSDPELAQALLDALSPRDPQGFSNFLVEPVGLQTSADVAASASLVGRHVGPYIIEAEIGRGGMGSVWRAKRADGRYQGTVAIKFVHATWIGGTGEQRFRIEGDLLARLDHPNIARLLDAGVIDGVQPYLILEYVEGQPIDAYCEQHKLDVAARIGLFLQVLAAVAHAHSHLVVHRDLKPSNIFVTNDGAATVKLLDFGIAKLLDPRVQPGAQTQSGSHLLTPQYAAPEQLLGLTVTTATDVYAMGLVLYLLLTGSHAVRSGARSSAELIHAIVTELPARASSNATVVSIPGRMLEGDLDNILHKALKKEPTERYASIGSFGEDLQRYLSHQPVQARADTVTYRMGKFVRRHRGGVTAGMLTLIAIVAGLVGTITQARRAEQQAEQAQRERDRALHELSYAEAANEFVNFLLGEGSKKPLTPMELLGRADQLVDKQFAHDPALRARLQLMIGDSYLLAADFDKTSAILRRAQESVKSVRDPALSAQIDCTLADADVDVGKLDEAATLFSQAVQRLRDAPEPDNAAFATCLRMRGELEAIQGNGKAALASGQEALRWLGDPRPGQRTLAVDAHSTVAEGYGRLGELASSIAEYETAMRETQAMGREHTTSASVTMNNLAEKYSRAGQPVQAVTWYRRASETAQEAEGEDNANALAEANYASSLFDNGRTSEALMHFNHAYDISLRLKIPLWSAYIQVMGAPALCAAADLSRCASWIDKARRAFPDLMPAGHSVFGILEIDAARLAMVTGETAKARDHLKRGLEVLLATADPRPSAVTALNLLARCEQQLGNGEAARGAADRAVTIARGLHTGFAQTSWIGSALLARAIVSDARGDADAAKATLLEALEHLEPTAGPSAADTIEAHTLLARLRGGA